VKRDKVRTDTDSLTHSGHSDPTPTGRRSLRGKSPVYLSPLNLPTRVLNLN